jgi:hypothetical protein
MSLNHVLCLHNAKDWAGIFPVIVQYMNHMQLMPKTMIMVISVVILCDEYTFVLMLIHMNNYLNKFTHRLIYMLGNILLVIRGA